MKGTDIFSMSLSSLFKRKVRTVLTILGVVIGIASIVIMVSLGLGLNIQAMEMIEEYGGLTRINVSPGGNNSSMDSGGTSSGGGDPTEYLLKDETVKRIAAIPHVKLVSPVFTFEAILKSGQYEYDAYEVRGYTLEALHSMNLEFAEGGFPKESEPLKFIYGNMIRKGFVDSHTHRGYWDTGVVPDVDFMKAPLFTILDVDGYRESQESGGNKAADGDSSGETQETKPLPKKYLIPAAGVLSGGEEDYHDYSYEIYCDIDAAIPVIKKVFKSGTIPGQPTKKNGKPYKEIFYPEMMVLVDKVDNVESVQSTIRELGYNAYSNTEWIEEERRSARSRQAMLGGVGAVSLLVAAIGIANTMMMSIYERTREIGIMKVLGCELSDIQMLFLTEAALIGLIGGAVGNIVSVGVSLIINFITKTTTSYIPVWLVAVGFFFAIAVAIAAGFFPSRRAMELSPLAAIRNE